MKILSSLRSSIALTRCGYMLAISLTLSATLLSGCRQMESSGTTTPPPTQPSNVPGAAGTVNGGQLPVSNASIQLYAVGSTGDGSAATPLLTASVTSDAYGGFSIANKYTCPSPATLVYLTATGGNPYLASGTNNTAIALMAALGPCGTLNSSTFIQMNELTTVASIFALAPYITSFDHLGYGTKDIAAFSTAFASVNQLVNYATGTIPGPDLPAGYEVPTTQINTIADILAGCVDSAGGVSGDTTPCGQLFQYTGGAGTTNTITAALQIADNPASNTTQLFSLVSSTSPFQPALNTAPASFTAAPTPITSTLPSAPAPTIATTGEGSFPVTVSISDSLGGVSIYYTTDGSTPTTSSSLYTTPLSITTATTVNAIAVADGYTNSPVTSSLITGTPSAPAPVITTAGGSSFPVTVSITDSLGGVSIHYTTDGSTPTATSPVYSAPLSISTATTINAIAVAAGYTDSSVTSSLITETPTAPAPAPTITTAGEGSFPATVSIADSLGGATIHYTIDGSTPTAASPVYTAPLSITTVTTINAIAVAAGYTNSSVTSSVITGTPIAAAPVITLGNESTFPVTVSIADSLSGATIHYTTDGSTPTAASPVYTAPLSITTVTTINAIAVAAGYTNSSVTSSVITGTPTVPAPVITAANESSYPITITITDSLSGATIHYTTDGSTPTAASPVYTSQIFIVSPTTISAIAVAPGYTNSPVAQSLIASTGSIIPTPTFSPIAATTLPVTVTISDFLNGTRIYYTTDGSTPTSASTLYTVPFVVSTVATVKAIAVQSGYADSQVASATYGYVSPAYMIKQINTCDPNSNNGGGCAPGAIAINSTTNAIYITNQNIYSIGAENVTFIDGNTDTVSGYAATQSPIGSSLIVVNPVTNKVYLGGQDNFVIDGATHAVTPINISNIDNPSPVEHLFVNPSTNQLDLLGINSLLVLNAATDSVIANVSTPGAISVDIDPARNHLYIGGSPNFLNVDASTGTIVDAFKASSDQNMSAIPASPSIAYNPTNNKVYIATDSVLVYDPATLATTTVNGTGIFGENPLAIAVNATTNTIYSASETTLYIIDGSTNTLTATVPLGTGTPFSGVQLLVDPVLNRVYVAGSYQIQPLPHQVNLSVLDGSTNILSTISATLGPVISGWALNPVTHKLYITGPQPDILDVLTPQ